ncbi:MAG TPA: GNAT family N-acetyltransferase [Caulobacteraceae bacterium]|jgi:GNAT superfamily N-acetyltransferase|nr:GNAT family N-acetyltransferase [Caulobacteraceae bacterium]
MIDAAGADAIERATLAALPPRVLQCDDGWLLCANEGVVSRANSVAPLTGGVDPLEAKIDRALVFYRHQGLRPAFRVSPYAQPAGLAPALAARGFAPGMTTLVMTRPLANAEPEDAPITLSSAPDAAWRALFIAPDVSAAEADLRISTLSRGQGTRFARLGKEGEVVAIGAASVSGDWAGVHGMRTLAAHRSLGHGAKVLSRLLSDARERGACKAFLQVEEDNTGAVRLYERLGFLRAYRYDYWRPVQPSL